MAGTHVFECARSAKEGQTLPRRRRNLVLLTAWVLFFALMATPAAQAEPINCVVQPQPPRGACYEPVWVDGRQLVSGGEVRSVDAAQVRADAQAAAEELFERRAALLEG